MRAIKESKRELKKLVVETVASPDELRERLKSAHAAAMLKLGSRLVELKLITAEQLDGALRIQRADSSRHLGQVLIDLGLLSEAHLGQIVCEQLGIPLIDFDRFPLQSAVVRLLPKKVAQENTMVAVCLMEGQLFVAMADPLDTQALARARFCAQMNVIPVMGLRAQVQAAILAHYDHAVIPYAPVATAHSPIADMQRESGRSAPLATSAERPSYTAGAHEPQKTRAEASKKAMQVAVVETVGSPEQLAERLRTQHTAAMLKLGVRLIELELITRKQLEHALHVQRADSTRHLGHVLFELGYISEVHLKQVVCEQLGIALVRLEEFPVDHAVLRLLPEKSAREYGMLPLCCIEAQLVLAMSNPLDNQALEHARFCAEMAVMPVMALRYELESAIRNLYDGAVQPHPLLRRAPSTQVSRALA